MPVGPSAQGLRQIVMIYLYKITDLASRPEQ